MPDVRAQPRLCKISVPCTQPIGNPTALHAQPGAPCTVHRLRNEPSVRAVLQDGYEDTIQEKQGDGRRGCRIRKGNNGGVSCLAPPVHEKKVGRRNTNGRNHRTHNSRSRIKAITPLCFLLRTAIGLGRHALYPLEVLAEDRLRGEIEFVAYLLHSHRGG